MAREVASRVSPSTATRKSDKKAARVDQSGLLGKVFAGAVGVVLLPALLLVLRSVYMHVADRSSQPTQPSQPDNSKLAELAATLQTLKDSLEVHRDSPVVVLSGPVVDFAAEHPAGVLVEFYMPDCDHCNKLFPEYDKAARELAASGGPPLAALNGEAYPEVAKAHNVSRYPTVLWFREGEAVQELKPMSRTKEKIVEFVNWVQQPAFTDFGTRGEFDEAVPVLRQNLEEKSPPVVVGFAGSDNIAVQDVMERVGERLRGKALFLYVSTPAEEVATFRSYSASTDTDSLFTGSISPESVQQWVESLFPDNA